MANALNWFDIPTTDIDRAKKFYDTILGKELQSMDGPPGFKMFTFPADYQNGEVAGALIQGDGYTPTQSGTLVYLNAQPDLKDALARVPSAGGKVIQEKSPIGENGFIAFIEDTEGNKVSLHSMQ